LAIVHGTEWLRQRADDEHLIGPGALKVDPSTTAAHVVRDAWATQPSAARVALLGGRRILSGRCDDPWTLAPVYIRPSAAEEKAASQFGNSV
jgi:hypothetical protein